MKKRNVLKLNNNKKDFKAVELNLKGTEALFIKNTNKLIYKSFKDRF